MFAAQIDPLATLASEPGVAAAVTAAREEIDSLLWRRDIRSNAQAVAAASIERGARDSAAIDGADVFAVDDSPMGRLLASSLVLTAEIPSQVDIFERAPLQVIAHLHALVARGHVSDDLLGRPRLDAGVAGNGGDRAASDAGVAGTGSDRATASAIDPLHLGELPPASAVSVRLTGLADLLTTPTDAPALVVAAIAHAEVAVLRPFAWGSGLISRALVRLVLASRGVDPSLFSIPELGILELGRPAYVKALRSYATGTSAGVSDFLVWHATAVALGARAVTVP